MSIAGALQATEYLSGSLTKDQGLAGAVSTASGVSGSVTAEAQISGNLHGEVHLAGNVASTGVVCGNLSAAYTTQAATYDGEYDVTPKVDKQLLKTKHKYMTDDVRVLAIPYFEVGNATGGSTVYIAGEIEIE